MKTQIKRFTSLLVAIALCFNLGATEPLKIPDDSTAVGVTLKTTKSELDTAHIDVLVVYTPAAEAWASTRGGIDKRIDDGFFLANLTMQNSEVPIVFHMVKSMKENYTESGSSLTDLRRITFGYSGVDEMNDTVRYFVSTREMRDSVGADLVILVPAAGDAAGMAWQLSSIDGRPNYGYSLVMVHYFNTLTMPHEIGHNMGAHHSKEQSSSPGPGVLFPYSAGWRWAGSNMEMYVSTMTYPSGSYYPDRLGGSRVPYFSNPSILYKDVPTGVEDYADNARTLRQIMHVIASYRERVVPPIPPIELAEVTVKISDIAYDYARIQVTAQGDSISDMGIYFGVDSMELDKHSGEDFDVWLQENTKYYTRGYVVNPAGEAVSKLLWFTTPNKLAEPAEVSVTITNILHDYAKIEITVKGDSISDAGIYFGESPLILQRISGLVHEPLLRPITTYYVKGYVINPAAEVVTELTSFTTLNSPVVVNPPIEPTITIYPNPSTGAVFVKFDGKFRVTIVSELGKGVIKNMMGYGLLQVNLTRGTYYFEVTSVGKVKISLSQIIIVQ